MKRVLTTESALRLQHILSKRAGRLLSDKELQEAYSNLMDFAVALLELSSNTSPQNYPIAMNTTNSIRC